MVLPQSDLPTDISNGRDGDSKGRPSAAVLAALQKYWGFDRLRSPQAEVIQALLDGRDALIVLPTGYGKSLCFQLPAILQSGTTLVISPLVALMEDQVERLRQRGLSAGALHGQLNSSQKRKTLSLLERGSLRLLYLSPEMLLSQPVWGRLQHPSLAINGAIVDEAHTVADWGPSFRPAYMRLGAIRRGLKKRFPLAAFTATADVVTQSVLKNVLELENPLVVRASPRRSHIRISISVAWTAAGRRKQLVSFVRHHQDLSGLIYSRTRDGCRELVKLLRDRGLSTAAYHGGLAEADRRQLEREWLSGKRKFLVCTNAFGMGIDLPHVRWVAHYQPSPSITDYVQEIGRAGRDGKAARTLMLVSEPTGLLDSSDIQLRNHLRERDKDIDRQAKQMLSGLPIQGCYDTIIDRYGRASALTLALLRREGCLVWQDPFRFSIANRSFNGTSKSKQNNKVSIESLLNDKGCRWQAIERSLGYANSPPCANCDNCIRASERNRRVNKT